MCVSHLLNHSFWAGCFIWTEGLLKMMTPNIVKSKSQQQHLSPSYPMEVCRPPQTGPGKNAEILFRWPCWFVSKWAFQQKPSQSSKIVQGHHRLWVAREYGQWDLPLPAPRPLVLAAWTARTSMLFLAFQCLRRSCPKVYKALLWQLCLANPPGPMSRWPLLLPLWICSSKNSFGLSLGHTQANIWEATGCHPPCYPSFHLCSFLVVCSVFCLCSSCQRPPPSFSFLLPAPSSSSLSSSSSSSFFSFFCGQRRKNLTWTKIPFQELAQGCACKPPLVQERGLLRGLLLLLVWVVGLEHHLRCQLSPPQAARALQAISLEGYQQLQLPVVPHKAVAEVSKIGNL